MTYRDTEDALRARIQALESNLAQRAREGAELRDELARARQELATMQQVQEPPRPRTLLALGAAGTILNGLAILLLNALRLVDYTPWLFQLTYGAADLGVGLGMLGYYRVTRQRLALAAAILLLVGPLDALFELAVGIGGIGFAYYSWLRALSVGMVLGFALVQAPDPYLRPWKRNLAGVLCFVSVFFGALSFAFFALRVHGDLGTDVLEHTLTLMRYVSYPSMVIHLGKNVALLLCFLALRRPRA